ncbi:MAG: serine--tRNA ligase [Candidatus Thermoplasmatota archaeon]
MVSDIDVSFVFSDKVASYKNELSSLLNKICNEISTRLIKDNTSSIQLDVREIKDNTVKVNIKSTGDFRPHSILLQMRNTLSKEIGKKYHLGVREIRVNNYTFVLDVEREPLKEVSIPFADVTLKGKEATISIKDVDEEFLQGNYIDRMITLLKDKVKNQYYEGKAEYWRLIWCTEEKKPVWDNDPTEEMVKKGWLKPGPTKGKWFYYPQAASILKTMERIAIEEVLKPLGFQEVVESHIVPFDIWLRTGHLEGMPGEIYYIVEPATRDTKDWERFMDLTRITKKVHVDELMKNLSKPNAGVCYAQCPMIYWSFKGKTISEKSLPVLVYDKTAISCRYESGGRHGIERVDEFHRIEPVYIGTREHLLELRDKLIERYKHVFNDIFDLEWRMAWVTPWYMQQAGKSCDAGEDETGTIDFEAYMPYRGDRENSEWLEFQNLSILGDKYVKAFTIKSQRSELWSGCSGIGLERWMIAFLAQKGLNPECWPKGFKRYLDSIPEWIEFL